MLGFFKKLNKQENKSSNSRRITSDKPANSGDFVINKKSEGLEKKTLSSKIHSEKVRGFVRHFLQFLFVLTVTSGIALLCAAGYRHATTSSYFEFKNAVVSGNERLGEQDLLKAADIKLGQNIFSIDINAVKNNIQENAWVQDVNIVRRLPGTLAIRIVEHKPRALINFDVLYLVNDTGKVFKRWVRGDPISSPIITGISREEYLSSPSTVENVLCDAIDLADRYAASGLERTAPLQEIYREPDMGFSMTVGEDPIYIKFGKGPYKKKITRLGELLSRFAQEKQRPEQIFFDNEIRPDRITVKMKQGENVEEKTINKKKIE